MLYNFHKLRKYLHSTIKQSIGDKMLILKNRFLTTLAVVSLTLGMSNAQASISTAPSVVSQFKILTSTGPTTSGGFSDDHTSCTHCESR